MDEKNADVAQTPRIVALYPLRRARVRPEFRAELAALLRCAEYHFSAFLLIDPRRYPTPLRERMAGNRQYGRHAIAALRRVRRLLCDESLPWDLFVRFFAQELGTHPENVDPRPGVDDELPPIEEEE